MSLLYIWRLCLQNRMLMVVGLLLGLAGGWAVTTLPPTYEATSSILVRPRGDADLRLYTGTPERFARSQARIAGSDLVLDLAAGQLGGDNTRTRLESRVTVEGGTADDVIDVKVKGSSRADAETTAAAVVAAYESATRAGTELLGTSVEDDTRSLARTLPLGAAMGILGALLAVLVLGAVRAPALTPGQLTRSLPHRVFPLVLGSRLNVTEESGRLRLVLQYLQEVPGPGRIVVTGLDSPRMEARLTKALQDVAPPEDVDKISAMGDRLDGADVGPVRAVLCCVRTGTPMGRVQEHLASLEIVPGFRLVVMGA